MADVQTLLRDPAFRRLSPEAQLYGLTQSDPGFGKLSRDAQMMALRDPEFLPAAEQRAPAPGEGPQLVSERKFQHPMSQIVHNLSRTGLIPRLLEPKPSDPNLAVLDTRGPATQEPILPLEVFSPQRGPQRAALQVAGGLTTPENLALLVGTAGLGKVKNVGRALERLTSAGFSASMITSAVQADPEWKEAYERGDKLVMSEIATRKVLELAMGAAAGYHAAVPKTAAAPVVERAVPKAEAAPPPIPDKALEVVRAAPEGPIGAKHLADEMGISRSAALDVLKGLQEAGHLEQRGGRYYRVAEAAPMPVAEPPVAPREQVTPVPIEELTRETEEARGRQRVERPEVILEEPPPAPLNYQPQPTPMSWQDLQRLRRGTPGPPSEPVPPVRPPIERYRTLPRVTLEEIAAEREQRAVEAARQEQLRLDEAAAEVERQRDLDELERQQRERDRLVPPPPPPTWQDLQRLRRGTPGPVEPPLPEPAPAPLPPKSKQARMAQRAAAKKAKAAEPVPVVEPAPPPAPEVRPAVEPVVTPAKEAVRDLEDQARLPGEERKGQEPVQAEPVERAGPEAAPAGGVLQEAQEVVGPAPPPPPPPAPIPAPAPPVEVAPVEVPSPKSKEARMQQRKVAKAEKPAEAPAPVDPWARERPTAVEVQFGKESTKSGRKEMGVWGTDAEGTVERIDIKDVGSGEYSVTRQYYEKPPGPENKYGQTKTEVISSGLTKREAKEAAEAYLKGQPDPMARVTAGYPFAEYKRGPGEIKVEESRFSPGWILTKTPEGKPVITEGHVMLVGEAPKGSPQAPSEGITKGAHAIWSETKQTATTAAEPVAVYRRGLGSNVVLENGTHLDPKYVDFVRKRYPDAEFRVNPKKADDSVAVYSKGEMVGVIAPKRGGEGLPQRVQELLKAPKPEPAPAPKSKEARLAQRKPKEEAKPGIKDFLTSESGTMRLPESLEKRIQGEKTEPVPERETERKAPEPPPREIEGVPQREVDDLNDIYQYAVRQAAKNTDQWVAQFGEEGRADKYARSLDYWLGRSGYNEVAARLIPKKAPGVKDFLESESGTMRLPQWLEKRIRGEKTEAVPERETERKEPGGKTLGPYEGKPRMLTDREKAQAREEAVDKAEFYIKYLDKPRERSYAQKYVEYLKGERKSPPLRIGLHDSKARLIRLNLDSAFDAGEFAPKAGPGPLPSGFLRTEPLEETFRREAFEQKLTQPPPGMRKTMGPDTGPREPSELPRPVRKVLGAAEDFLESESGEFRPERLKELAAVGLKPFAVKGKQWLRSAIKSQLMEDVRDFAGPLLYSKVRRAGKGAGKPLEEALERTAKGETTGAGRLMQMADAELTKLSRDEWFNLKDAMQGREKPKNSKVERAFVVLRELTDEIGGEAIDLDVMVRDREGNLRPFGEVMMEHYFPQIIHKAEKLRKGEIRTDVIENLQRDNPKLDEAAATKMLDDYLDYVENIKEKPGEALIQHIMEKHNVDSAKALEMMHRHRDRQHGPRRHGALEHEREVDLPFYDPNPQRVMPAHVLGSSMRLAQIRELGQNNEILNKHLEAIKDATNDRHSKTVRDEVDRMMGWVDDADTRAGKWSRGIRAIEGFRMGYAGISNFPQGFQNTMTHADLPAAVAGLYRSFTKEGRRFAEESGATLEQTMREMTRDLGGGSEMGVEKALRKYLDVMQYTRSERRNRLIAANGAHDWTTRQFDKLKRTNGQDRFSREALEELGIDADAALKRGKLTVDEVLNAARKFSDIANFRARPQDVPKLASTPMGKVAFQFMPSAYGQTRFFFRHTVGEWQRGNYGRAFRNLFYMTALFPSISGEIIADIRAWLNGKKRAPFGDWRRHANNMIAGQTLGMLSDVLESGSHGRLAEIPVGPFVGDIAELGEIALDDKKHKGRRLAKWAVRHVPPVRTVTEKTGLVK